MRQRTLRLRSGQLLKEEIEKVAAEEHISAGALFSIVAALSKTRLRMAGARPNSQAIKEYDEPMEVVSGTGTISEHGCHIHISVADKEGRVRGGHLKDGCVVAVTAEIVLGIFDDVSVARIFDEETGWKELAVSKK